MKRREELEALLRRVVPTNAFYRAKLAVTANLDHLYTTKAELIQDQLANPPFGTNLTFPLARYTRFSQTSATTGKPMRWLDTPESWSWMLDNWTRVFRAAGVVPADRVFFAFSFGPFLGFWTAFEAATRMGCLAIPGGGMRSGARLRAILDVAANVLCCTPTYAIHLAEAAAEEDIDLSASPIRTILVAGEPGGSIPGTRARIERLWPGARVVDHHGMTEVGPVSYGCPARAGVLHVMEESFIAEVADNRELILTNLGREGSPLIRYRTGDIVQPAPPGTCVCGSTDLALVGGILGRTDDMVVVRGVNVYPAAVEDVVSHVGGVAEYRVRVFTERSLTELGIEAEPDAAHMSDQGLAHRIEAALRDALALRIPVTLVAPGSLPRFEMKARRWVRS
jgi:phenylacetate-CoA ligase